MSLQHLGNPPLASDRQVRPFSPAVRAGDFVFVSGQVPANAQGEIVRGGIEAQTRQVFANLRSVLALAGCTLDDVCKATVWLHDARDFGSFNRVYLEEFSGNKPARSTVESRLMVDAKVEIDVVAYKPLAEAAKAAKP
ncbi:MAG TPA: RidA family protein [Burkholderiaceae bacterium]